MNKLLWKKNWVRSADLGWAALAMALLLSAFLLGMCWQSYRHSVQENEQLHGRSAPAQRDR